MKSNNKESLKDLAIRFLKKEKIAYPLLKVEAFYEKNWIITDNLTYYMECEDLLESIDGEECNLCQLTLKDWFFEIESNAKTKENILKLRLEEYKECEIDESKLFRGANLNILFDPIIRNLLKQYPFKTNQNIVDPKSNPTQQTNKRVQNITNREETSKTQALESSRKNSVRDFFDSTVKFIEIVTADQFDPRLNKKNDYIENLFLNFSKEDDDFKHSSNKGQLDDHQLNELCHVSFRMTSSNALFAECNVDSDLRQHTIKVDEIILGNTNGYINWTEIEFPRSCFSRVKENTDYFNVN